MKEFEPQQRVALESIGIMQQHNYNALIQKEHKLDKPKKEEVVPRYIFTSFLYYRHD
jgi:hypothetical protein